MLYPGYPAVLCVSPECLARKMGNARGQEERGHLERGWGWRSPKQRLSDLATDWSWVILQSTSQFPHGKMGIVSTGKHGCEGLRHPVHLAWHMAGVFCNMVDESCALDKTFWVWISLPHCMSTGSRLTYLHCFLVCGMNGASSVFLWLCSWDGGCRVPCKMLHVN